MNTPNLDGYKGRYMAKADGMKVYLFCYEFVYVITLTDPDLTVISCMTGITDLDLPEMTNKPDIIVAETLIEGSLVYIDTLGFLRVGEAAHPPLTGARARFSLTSRTKMELRLEPTPNDGVVLVNEFRTMRLKQPTVDLIYEDGKQHASDNGVMVPIAIGDIKHGEGGGLRDELGEEHNHEQHHGGATEAEGRQEDAQLDGRREEGNRQHGQGLSGGYSLRLFKDGEYLSRGSDGRGVRGRRVCTR